MVWGGAKDGVDELCLVVALLQAEQGAFHVFEQFAAFGDEDEEGLVEVHEMLSVSTCCAR